MSIELEMQRTKMRYQKRLELKWITNSTNASNHKKRVNKKSLLA